MYSSTAKENAPKLSSNTSNVWNMEEMKETLQAKANKAVDKVKDFVQTATDEISHAKETVTTRIHDKPVQSSFVALGIGFMLGALVRGK